MIRVYIVIGVLCAIAIGSAYFGWSTARTKNALERTNDTLQNSQEFNDATSNPTGCGWTERLRRTCAD